MASHAGDPKQDATMVQMTPLPSPGDNLSPSSTRQTGIHSLSAVGGDSHAATPDASTGSERSMEEPLSTTLCLQNFGKVLERNIQRAPQIEKEKRRIGILEATTVKDHQPPYRTLARLRAWAHPTPKTFWQRTLMPIFPEFGRPARPSDKDLEHLANHYFPRRGDVKIRICDFGDERVVYSETTLEHLESCMERSSLG
jgi:hypothetical protein